MYSYINIAYLQNELNLILLGITVSLRRMRSQPIRTISEIPIHIKILPIKQIPLYEKLFIKAKQLHALEISYHNSVIY